MGAELPLNTFHARSKRSGRHQIKLWINNSSRARNIYASEALFRAA